MLQSLQRTAGNRTAVAVLHEDSRARLAGDGAASLPPALGRVVQRVRMKSDAKKVWVKANEKDVKDVVDSRHATIEQREQYRKDLSGNLPLLKEVKSEGASGAELGKQSKLLSEKEWQALADVVRTTEVLLSEEVPKEAVKKKK